MNSYNWENELISSIVIYKCQYIVFNRGFLWIAFNILFCRLKIICTHRLYVPNLIITLICERPSSSNLKKKLNIWKRYPKAQLHSSIKQVSHVVSMQRSRTTVEGTKPQCQPIDLRCSLRGPLLRREKNKLIERGSEENGRRERKRNEGKKETPSERERGKDPEGGSKRKNVELEERALLEEENERGRGRKEDQKSRMMGNAK